MRHSLRMTGGVIALAMILACTGTGSRTGASESTTATAATESVDTTAAEAATTTIEASTTADRVSANIATVDEIAAALAAAGVDEAERWAREVVEYRPYDASDTDLTHLREELAKYDPAEGVVDLIVSVLAP